MKKIIPFTLLACSFAIFSLTSCSDSDDTAIENTETLTSDQKETLTVISKVWVLDSHTQITTEGFTPQPILRNMVFTINNDFTYNLVGDNIPPRTIPEDGTWSFFETQSNKIILNPVTKFELHMDVKQLSETNMELDYNFVDQRFAGITLHNNTWIAQ